MFVSHIFSPLSSIFFFSLLPTPQSHHHEEEKRALSREIIVLNNHLMEAKITINKLREDNVSAESRTVGCELPTGSGLKPYWVG